MSTTTGKMDELESGINPFELILMMVATAGGTLMAAVILPAWLPGLTESLLGKELKVFWYVARSSGVVAYLLLWLSVVFGLVVSNKMARLWNGGPTAVELHQFVTWLALALALCHALILLGDRFIRATLDQVLMPFSYVGYQPFWVGLGQIGFYLSLIIALSFYVRKRVGYRAWRTLHYTSFVIYFLLSLHGIFAGTDTATPGLVAMYALTGVSIYFLTLVRVFDAIRGLRVPSHVPHQSSSHSPPPR